MKPRRTRNIIILIVVAVAWVILDQATKSYFATFAVGEAVGTVVPGILEFTLVHNTGAAWGMLGDMTLALGIVSILVCVLAAGYVVVSPDLPLIGVIGLALVVGGGIGNAIDRFSNGYVVDFINATFIDFPVFNVADIGVTCGVVLFAVSIVIQMARSAKEEGDA